MKIDEPKIKKSDTPTYYIGYEVESFKDVLDLIGKPETVRYEAVKYDSRTGKPLEWEKKYTYFKDEINIGISGSFIVSASKDFIKQLGKPCYVINNEYGLFRREDEYSDSMQLCKLCKINV